MNDPLIIETPLSVKDRLDLLLTATEFGLCPKDGSTDEEREQATRDQAVVAQAIKDVHAAETDLDADRAFMIAMATLASRGCKRSTTGAAGSGLRHQVAAARIASDRGPLPAYAAAAQHLGMQGSPIPVRAAQQLAQVGGAL